MLHLIFGGAGTGKSTQISRAIAQDVEEGRRAFLIIPEQQANLTERSVLPYLPKSAGLTFTIAGFSRLYERVAAKHGGITVRPPDRALRMLMLWECMRTLSPLLEEYRLPADTAPDGALTALMLQTLQELQSSSISPRMLEEASAALPKEAPLSRKLRDIALLYATYEARIASVTESDGKDTVAHLAELLQRFPYFEGANVYIDSFTDFTAEEFTVLRQLLTGAQTVTVALCCDGLTTRNPAFESAADTARRLVRICREQDVPVTYTHLREPLRTVSPELQLLSEHLWDFSYIPTPQDLPAPDARGAITMLRCDDIYAEAQAAALHILDERHKGTPYGRMAIIVRDAETYRGVLDAALERYGIPYYFSDKSALSEKPLSRFLISALRAVTYRFPAQEILTMLKTGLASDDAAAEDLFEQYVQTWGISGSAFLSERWTRNPDGYTERTSARGAAVLEAANRIREQLITPLLQLYTALHAAKSLPDCCCALYDYMERMQLAERCARIAEAELAAGYVKEAGETLRVYDTVVDTLARLADALPDVNLTPEELCAALSMLLSQSEMASVPSLHDSVTVGAADTLRVENIDVCMLLGLCEGEFPRASTDTGLLAEADRKQLEALGVVLDNSGELRSSRELMYVWRAMTKPARHLFALTADAAPDGSKKVPSIAYNRLFYLFPYLKDSLISFRADTLRDEPTPEPIAPSLTDAPASEPDPDGGLTEYRPLPPSPYDIAPETARALLGDTLYLSQSRIQTYVQCPFRFYCTYLLDLRERKVAQIDYADSGTFFHYLLEKMLSRCLGEDGSFTAPAPEQIAPLADSFVNEYLRTLLCAADTDALRSARLIHLFSRLRTMAMVLLHDVLGELSHSRFLPSALELRIGGHAPDTLPPYELQLQDGSRVLLGGTVDRVDTYRVQDTVYLRVIDYKSGSKTFSLSDVRQGVNLQLLLYLFALCRNSEHCRPAGAMYLSVKESRGTVLAERSGLLLDDPALLQAMNDQADPHYLAGVRTDKKGEPYGSALIDEQALHALENDIRATLRAIASDMRQGRAAKAQTPDACRFCPLKGHCAGIRVCPTAPDGSDSAEQAEP